jgi:hypothetical protein
LVVLPLGPSDLSACTVKKLENRIGTEKIMKTTNKGIDYGLGKTNVDTKTGIRYGVIHQNEVLQAWYESSEAYYPCKDCENHAGEDEDYNSHCDFCEPTSHYIDDKEYQAEADSYGDIFIMKSPYYTKCQLCSPCAPGAGYIMNSCDEGYMAYCFGHDWFWDTETTKAPYPVYRVSDNTLVA